jgi:hypothetical protein
MTSGTARDDRGRRQGSVLADTARSARATGDDRPAGPTARVGPVRSGTGRVPAVLLLGGAVVDAGDADHDRLAQQRGQRGGTVRSLGIRVHVRPEDVLPAYAPARP